MIYKKKLNYLMSPYLKSNLLNKIKIKSLVMDSRRVQNGDLFIARSGDHFDGKNFIFDAILNGAQAILSDTRKNKIYINSYNKIPIIYLPNLSEKLSNIASRFYNKPSKKLDIIAVTGTNGKTTITNLLSQWISLLGKKSAIIGTLGNGIGNKLIKTNYTTDSAITIQKFLNYFFKKKVDFVSIEVSSHGILQHRVKSLSFKSAIFTNLTHDHLDYHKNMINYELAKKMLFCNYKIENIIINADDKIGLKWLCDFPNAVAVSIKNNFNIENYKYWLKVCNISFQKDYVTIKFKSSWGHETITSYLLGYFNITNILLALAALLSMNFPLKKLVDSVEKLKPIRGRMELFKSQKKSNVIIDYAHTPESLKTALKSARIYCKNNIWCIFGCGGNRDKFKRPIMGKIAKKYSDVLIITNDNPRYEMPKKIINDIIEGIYNMNEVYIIYKRKKAIEYAIQNAKKNDLIFLSGKGHENYQIIKNVHLPFSDREIVINCLKK